MGRAWLAVLLSAVTSASVGAQPAADVIRPYLQQRFADERDLRFASSLVDLNGDGRAEAILYLMSGALCGTGGCALLVLTPEARGWRQIGYLTVTNPPIRLLTTRSRGWRDLGVRVSGGGARARDVRVTFNGRAYASNPSMLLTHRPGRAAPSRELIIDDDPGRPLF